MKTISINVGTNKTRWTIFDENMKTIDYGQFGFYLFHTQASKVIFDVSTEIINVLKNNNGITSCSITIQGTVINKNIVTESSAFLSGFNNLNLEEEFRKYIDIDVFVYNEVEAIAVGEIETGNLDGINNAVIINFGESISGAIIINRKLFKTKNNLSGNFGKLRSGGEDMDSSQSFFSIKNKIYLTTGIEVNDPEEIQPLAEKNDDVKELIKKNREFKLEQIGNIIEILDPEAILMCGKIYDKTEREDIYPWMFKEMFTENYGLKNLGPLENRELIIKFSKLKELSSIYGMAVMTFSEVKEK